MSHLPSEDPLQDVDAILIDAGLPRGPLQERVAMRLRSYIVRRDHIAFNAGCATARRRGEARTDKKVPVVLPPAIQGDTITKGL